MIIPIESSICSIRIVTAIAQQAQSPSPNWSEDIDEYSWKHW